MNVPEQRIRIVNHNPINPEGQYVLYWMIAYRRTRWNFALQRAVEMANTLDRPLLIFEPLDCDYPYASDRLHRFVLQGMAENLADIAQQAGYFPYVETSPNFGKGLLAALSVQSCLLVTDDYPAFIAPRLIAAAGTHMPMRVEAVDSNGLLPMRLVDQAYPTAYAFRRFLQKNLPPHLMTWPQAKPLTELHHQGEVTIPESIKARWPSATGQLKAKENFPLHTLPIDHKVDPVNTEGGQQVASERLHIFLEDKLDRYADERNHPDLNATSGLSPYLHFGHISSHAIFSEIIRKYDWSPHDLSHRTDGKRSGWWRLPASSEAFLDQLVTWRELGFNMCVSAPESYKDYGSLPEWARRTLDEHRRDSRPHCYSLKEFQYSKTHDPLWNAAQNQLRETGVLHNYLRMLWGKKILEWSASPEEALETMVDLNDRYALDGRDPNSYSGILWCLGRYDRPWGPERDVFGKIRYMSSANTMKKIRLNQYLETYS